MTSRHIRAATLIIVGFSAIICGCGHSSATPATFAAANASSAIRPVKMAKAGQETATFAAGCFWSMEAIFKQLKGVVSVEPGYAGGDLGQPTYEQVETGTTGFAETANIIFDPKIVDYKELLKILLTVRDPTSVDRQGNDVGPQYRSIIFVRDQKQADEAHAAIRAMNATDAAMHKPWSNPIVTTVQPFKTFYRAEDYHLNYYALHPNEGYCAFVIKPEIENFRSLFKDKLK